MTFHPLYHRHKYAVVCFNLLVYFNNTYLYSILLHRTSKSKNKKKQKKNNNKFFICAPHTAVKYYCLPGIVCCCCYSQLHLQMSIWNLRKAYHIILLNVGQCAKPHTHFQFHFQFLFLLLLFRLFS